MVLVVVDLTFAATSAFTAILASLHPCSTTDKHWNILPSTSRKLTGESRRIHDDSQLYLSRRESTPPVSNI